MAYRKKTLRNMSPTARRYARLINELESVQRRLKNMTDDISRLELDSRALFAQQQPRTITTEQRTFLDDPNL